MATALLVIAGLLLAQPLAWPSNPYAPGTIEHDAFYVTLALEHLARGTRVSLHGHSRGGAVALEAGRQSPRLARPPDKSVTAILEAPVLPGARAAGRSSDPLRHALISYLLPVALGLLRNASAERGRALNPGVRILRTARTNHFVSLERPEYLRQLHEPAQAGR
ncbi:MAG: hypothetical protein R3E54_16640 [Halioglobus sp.]